MFLPKLLAEDTNLLNPIVQLDMLKERMDNNSDILAKINCLKLHSEIKGSLRPITDLNFLQAFQEILS